MVSHLTYSVNTAASFKRKVEPHKYLCSFSGSHIHENSFLEWRKVLAVVFDHWGNTFLKSGRKCTVRVVVATLLHHTHLVTTRKKYHTCLWELCLIQNSRNAKNCDFVISTCRQKHCQQRYAPFNLSKRFWCQSYSFWQWRVCLKKYQTHIPYQI